MEKKVRLLPPNARLSMVYVVQLPPTVTSALEKATADEVYLTMDRRGGKCTLEVGEKSLKAMFNKNPPTKGSRVELYEVANGSCQMVGGIGGRVSVMPERGNISNLIKKDYSENKATKEGKKLKLLDPASSDRRGIRQSKKSSSGVLGVKRERNSGESRLAKMQKVGPKAHRSSSASSRAVSEPAASASVSATALGSKTSSTSRPLERSKMASPAKAVSAANGRSTSRTSSLSPASRKVGMEGMVSPLHPPRDKQMAPPPLTQAGGTNSSSATRAAKRSLPPLPPRDAVMDEADAARPPLDERSTTKDVVHVLAVQPLSESALDERVPHGSRVLEKVANVNAPSSKFSLKPELWAEVSVDWPKYSDEEREKVARNIRRSQLMTDTELRRILEGEIPAKPHKYSSIQSEQENEKYRVEFNRKYRIYNSLGRSINELLGQYESCMSRYTSASGKKKEAVANEMKALHEKTDEKDSKMRKYYSVLHSELGDLKRLISAWAEKNE
mmetsp:Transcript_3776/g.11252  ORF Transcript_3776/g.11252 Transcript_3776/m.11252 type:complete len:501 (+) Transcript_3776:143-1645(+)